MALKKILKSVLNVNYIRIKNVEFDSISSSLHIYVDITKGQKSRCPICGKKCSGYDSPTEKRLWRSLDFGSCKVYICYDINRIYCSKHGVLAELVPWAYPHSNFTKEFEQQVAYLALHLNKTEVSKLMRINWRTVGAVLSRTKNRLEPDSSIRFNDLKRIGIDETSYRKGHKYITVIVDHDRNQVIWVGKGTGKEVLSEFFTLLTQDQKENIELVSADGAKWITSCIKEWLPNAERCIDGFHVVQWAVDCMDELRKEVWREDKQEKKAQPKRGRGRPKKGEEIVDYLSGDPQNGYRVPLTRQEDQIEITTELETVEKDVRISEVTYDPEEKTYRIHVKTEGTDSFGREFSDTDGGLTLQFMIRLPQKNRILTEEDIESLGVGNVYGYRPGDRIGYANYLMRFAGASLTADVSGTGAAADTYIVTKKLIYRGQDRVSEDGGTGNFPAQVLDRPIKQKIRIQKEIEGEPAIGNFRFKAYLKSNLERLFCDENGNIVWLDRNGAEVDINEYRESFPELVARYYNTLTADTNDAVEALTAAFVQDGAFVYVPKGVAVERTIQVVNLLRSNVDLMVNRRVLVVLEDGAQARLLFCDHAMDDREFLTTQVVEVFAGADAHLDLYELEETHVKNRRFSNMYVDLQRGSVVNLYNFTLHNGLTRNRTDVSLSGEGAEVNLYGGVIADKEQHVDNNTLIDHRAERCTSRQLYKYVMDGRSVGAFAGRVLVRHGAQRTVSEERNANLCAT